MIPKVRFVSVYITAKLSMVIKLYHPQFECFVSLDILKAP